MAEIDNESPAKELIERIRKAFGRQDWVETYAVYEQLSALKPVRQVRLEAGCLVARALAAQRQRPAARAILNVVSATTYRKAIHYEFLARAFLDLKQYTSAAEACVRAEELLAAEMKPTYSFDE